jgi:penicillin amidase
MMSARLFLDRAAGAAIGTGIIARALFSRRPRTLTVAERLAALPDGLPVRETVVIHWDAHQIPFIEARNDDDLAVALGAVHAHLRLGQMELLRRLSQGRVSELIGPLGVELDTTLRLFDFGRAVPAIIDGLSDPTRRWAEGFLRGVNHIIARAPPCEEFRVLGIPQVAWTMTDLFTAARLAAADVNWLVWPRLLRARRRLGPEKWAAVWTLLVRDGASDRTADGAGVGFDAMIRAGSNAAAVAARRGSGAAAILAADPHLSVALPNIWLACGFRSPGFNVVGLMPTGFPVVAIGRNPWMAWGGTSLHGDSSELFDVSGEKLSTRETRIGIRGGGVRAARLRDSPLGPVVSDGVPLRHRAPLAMRWTGHAPSDEMGALLGVMRARSAEEFRDALATFSVPAQNMLHAGRDGRVGQLIAGFMPRRPPAPPADVISDRAAASAWDRIVTAAGMPHWLDPPEGFVASANDRPPPMSVRIGTFFSPPTRVERMRALLGGGEKVMIDDLADLQRDVVCAASLAIRDTLLSRFSAAEAAHPIARLLREWNGAYAAESAGALAYELMIADLARRLIRPIRYKALSAIWTGRALIAEEILTAPAVALRRAIPRALRRAARIVGRLRNWGGAHRLALRHPFATLPVIGRRYRFGDVPCDGGNDTLNKSGHDPVRGKHRVRHGASARFIADMSNPNGNRVVLLGGQDGWIGSDTFLDQLPIWQRGGYIDLPLEAERARTWPHHTVHPPPGREDVSGGDA